MCGRYVLVADPEEIGRYHGMHVDPRFPARYNIAPSRKIPIVRSSDGERRMESLRWGLIPSWAKDAMKSYSTINAKAETIFEKPAFRAAIRSRRCLLPASGFYEWKLVDARRKEKVPYLIFVKDAPVFSLAGIWESWVNPAGEIVESCAIVTTAANALVREVHDRMPVILPRDRLAWEAHKRWLDPAVREPEAIREMLTPYPAEEMDLHPVSRRVNSPKNDDAECMTRVE